MRLLIYNLSMERLESLVGELTAVASRQPERIVCAWLFGSLARGDAGPLSDVDVGLLCADSLSREARWDLRIELAGHLARVDGPHIDVVILNDAPPLLQDRVLRHGRLLFCHDDRVRVAFESRSLMEYLDFEYYLRRFDDALLQRATEGSFAR